MKPRPGKYALQRHPQTGLLFSVLEARAVKLRGRGLTVKAIAARLHVGTSAVHRWVKGTPENEAAIRVHGSGARLYPPGLKGFANKLAKQGYDQAERIRLAHEVAAREQRVQA